MTADAQEKRCGFVAVLGLPNAGKSTLVNALVGAKVSIVSDKVQTTRSRVLGIAMHGAAQIVLIDTPGVFAPGKRLEKAMVRAAFGALERADAVVHLVDTLAPGAVSRNDMIREKLPKDRPCILVLNKIDKVKKPDLLRLSEELNALFPYRATYMISALKNQGTKDLLDELAGMIPAGEWIFDPEQTTDMPMRLMAAEITREKIFHQLRQELPYAAMVETETWETFEDGSVKIDQAVTVQKDSQKAIVLGRGGARIKQIGAAARREMEELFGHRVHLKLFVKVQEDWTERADHYRLIGLDFQA